MDTAAIEAAIGQYFDSSYELDKEKARDAFHPSAHIYSVDKNGVFTDMTVDAFMGVFDRLDSPKSVGQPREDKILSIEFTGEKTAVARVTLRIGGTRFTDILSFILTDNRWRIISKVASGITL